MRPLPQHTGLAERSVAHGTLPRTAKLAVFLAGSLFATSCALAPPALRSSGSSGSFHAAVHKAGSDYVLDRPLRDFYDTAFVLTDAGKIIPRVVSLSSLAGELLPYDVVFYGEVHSHPGVHLQQMELLRALVERDPHWIVSLEQFERDTQGVVNDYLAGRIGENALIDKGRAWSNYLTSYRPMLVFAQAHHLPVVAAEAPGWAVSCVGQWGPDILSAFTPTERSWVATELHVSPGPYRDKFMQFLGTSPSHGGGGTTPEAEARAERSFAAQLLRDDTMAESMERALIEHPGYKVLHLTGTFHAAGFLGTVERLKQLKPSLKIAVVDAVEVENPEVPSFSADEVHDGTALQLIYPTPAPFVDGDDMSGFSAKIKKDRDASRCKYSLDAPSAGK
jgi:uncharacterized iron-regulated protein